MEKSMTVVHDSERYELVRDIGSGKFGVAKLMRDKLSGELVAVKFIERGSKIDENVQREIINHRSLRHPNIVRFKEVVLTPTHLAIVMEYASGGELFERICNRGRFSEDEKNRSFSGFLAGKARSFKLMDPVFPQPRKIQLISLKAATQQYHRARFFFQQLISGVSYCHSMHVCHRDLKLENTLLDGSSAPRLKICDFGYSKSLLLHSQPKSTVGTPAYIAPEILLKREYDGNIADVWSCGVTLYVMLVGAYPFDDPQQPNNFSKTIQRILRAQYFFPDYVKVSPECLHLLSSIFVADPSKRITIPGIKTHAWFLKNLPLDLMEDKTTFGEPDQPMQSLEKIMQIIAEATVPAVDPTLNRHPDEIDDDMDEDIDSDYDLAADSSGEIVYAM